ncbi:MAG: GerMN domain-containing protein [Oscillospiraceae bacterium]|nr:GerMN domain-containing protein [Oscillospiraceae bacterium]
MKKLTLIILICLLLTGCYKMPEVPETDPLPGTSETQAVTIPAGVTITIYQGNDNADGFVTKQVQVEEVNMNVLVDELIKANVLTEDVSIGSMQFDGTCLNLSFSPSFGELICSMGTTGEYIIIGSVVNTFLDAYPGYESVFITIGHSILESGHHVYDSPMTRFE